MKFIYFDYPRKGLVTTDNLINLIDFMGPIIFNRHFTIFYQKLLIKIINNFLILKKNN